MAEWGRKEYAKKWPSRTPVWTWTAVLGSLVFFAGMLTLQYERSWSAAERLYLTDYLKSGARGRHRRRRRASTRCWRRSSAKASGL
jgi:hypothetical protein